jgi:phenylalanine-4-hydroxylase
MTPRTLSNLRPYTMEPRSQSRIVYLASIIASNTRKVDNYLSTHGLPSPFDVAAPLRTDLPNDIAQANNAVVEATSQLQALMLGPLGNVRRQAKDVG